MSLEGILALKAPETAVGGSSLRFDFSQPTPSALWTIAHNLGKRPIVEVYTLGGERVDTPDILHLNDNTLQITLVATLAGSAICLA